MGHGPFLLLSALLSSQESGVRQQIWIPTKHGVGSRAAKQISIALGASFLTE